MRGARIPLGAGPQSQRSPVGVTMQSHPSCSPRVSDKVPCPVDAGARGKRLILWLEFHATGRHLWEVPRGPFSSDLGGFRAEGTVAQLHGV